MQMNNSSKPYKIFGQQRGIDISQQYPQGRNVQPFSSNKKLEQGSQKLIQSPFDGYVPMMVDNSLAISQVNDLNMQLTKRFIKQQLSKFAGFDQSRLKNDIDIMKTQIRSMKQHMSQLGQLNSLNKSKDDEQIKKQIMKQVDKLLQQYHDQTARNLRQVIKKFDESIKKDCTSKFLPIGFVNDAQNQFLQLQDRIQLLQSKIDGNKKKVGEDPIVLAQQFQLRLKKGQREAQGLKKLVTELQVVVNSLNQSSISLKSKQNDDDERLRQKFQQFKKNSLQIQKQVKNLSLNIQELKGSNKQLSRKLVVIEQKQNQSPPKYGRNQSYQQSQVKQFLNSSKGLSTSSVYQIGKNPGQPTNYKQLFKSPIKQTLSHKSSTQSYDENKPISERINQPQICYRIDKDNYLLDDDGNYILNQQGKEIKLSEEQIGMLRKSTIVRLKE